MSAYVTLICPDCKYAKVYNGHGTCRCGAYLIRFWEGMYRRRSSLGLPFGKKVWGFNDNGESVLLKEAEHGGIT